MKDMGKDYNMEKKKTIFDFLSGIFFIFGVSIMILLALSQFFGEDAKSMSSMFVLGSQGLPADTMLQFFFVSVFINGISFLMDMENVKKRLPYIARIFILLLSVFLIVLVFIVVFDWFTLTSWLPWVCFVLSLGTSVTVSLLLANWKTRVENRKLEEGLARMRREWEEEDEEK